MLRLFLNSKMFALFLRSSLFCFLLFSNNAIANPNWQLNRDESGIKVYLSNTSTSTIKRFKGTIKVKGSLSTFLSVIHDISSYPRWVYNCRNAKLLKSRNNDEVVNYVVTNMPWSVADRDVIVVSRQSQNPSNKRVEIKFHAAPKTIAKVDGKVRIEQMHGRWLLTPIEKNQVEIIYEMQIDPSGNIPKWIVNAMAVDVPFHTLKNLRKISKEDKYINAKVDGILQ